MFKKGQIVTAIALALSHGTNDAQKTMGMITMGLVTSGYLKEFVVPFWVIFICAGMIALGTSLGGWRLIKTLGSKFYKMRPVDSFSIQLSSAIVILGASILGGPVSTTQVVSTAILGVGSAERINKVRWGVAGDIVIAWLLTIPATALVGAGIYWAISKFSKFNNRYSHQELSSWFNTKLFDIAFIGNYTKDTIITPAGTRYVDGGAVNYAAHAAIRLGKKTAVITHLAEEDRRMIDGLTSSGVVCFPVFTPHSTNITLEYPTADPDIRNLYITHVADPLEADELDQLSRQLDRGRFHLTW